MTPRDVRSYRERGVVVVPSLFRDEDLAPVQAEIEAWIDARARDLRERGHLEALCEDEPFERRYAQLFAQSPWIGAGLDVHLVRGPAGH